MDLDRKPNFFLDHSDSRVRVDRSPRCAGKQRNRQHDDNTTAVGDKGSGGENDEWITVNCIRCATVDIASFISLAWNIGNLISRQEQCPRTAGTNKRISRSGPRMRCEIGRQMAGFISGIAIFAVLSIGTGCEKIDAVREEWEQDSVRTCILCERKKFGIYISAV